MLSRVCGNKADVMHISEEYSKIRIQRAMGLAAVCLLLGTWLAACDSGMTGAPMIGKVDSWVIEHDDLRAHMAFMGLGNNPAALSPELRKAVLDELVQRRLITQKAEQMRIVLEPEELSREERALRGEMSDENFEHALSIQGLDYVQWRKVLADELLTRKVLELVITPQVKITASEIQAYYQSHIQEFNKNDSITAYHVVLPTKPLAMKVKKALSQGQNLNQVCYSLGITPPNQGLPGKLEKGHMPKKLEKQVFRLKKGAVGGPFASNYGFHVIMVVDKQTGGKKSLAEASENIQHRLSEERKMALAKKWLDNLYEKADIWYDPGFVKHGRLGANGS
jgi:parvulin-like peptidyl-prolyl isomerase